MLISITKTSTTKNRQSQTTFSKLIYLYAQERIDAIFQIFKNASILERTHSTKIFQLTLNIERNKKLRNLPKCVWIHRRETACWHHHHKSLLRKDSPLIPPHLEHQPRGEQYQSWVGPLEVEVHYFPHKVARHHHFLHNKTWMKHVQAGRHPMCGCMNCEHLKSKLPHCITRPCFVKGKEMINT